MSNYPPGVTGREPEIVGYDEREVSAECQGCEWEGEVVAEVIDHKGGRNGHTDLAFTCDECGRLNYFTQEPDEDW
jgi:uncharacterized Zn finger protein